MNDSEDTYMLILDNDFIQASMEKDLYACTDLSVKGNTTEERTFDEFSTCRPRKMTDKDCEKARRLYGGLPTKKECSEQKGFLHAEICRFTNDSYRTTDASNLNLQCDITQCKGNTIYIGKIHPDVGFLPQVDQWVPATNKNELDVILKDVITSLVKEEIDFCFITCTPKKKAIKQVLILPPLVRTAKRKPRKKFNINVIVLDSVSRQHFYRKLPKTAHMLKQININALGTDVLDFELFQSLAPRTFPNMRAFFSGEVNVDANDDDYVYRLDKLFGKYKSQGYQTLLQEDSCWFDQWGALVTNNIHDMTLYKTTEDFKERWTNLRKTVRDFGVDNFGLTHMSCEVFLQYGVTNQFNDPPKVCYNGKIFTTYFLHHLQSYFNTIQRTKKAKPFFAYTHLNAGHEKTGKRISYTDEELAAFVESISQVDNTLTIILSDHGPKTTKYAREELIGRYELAHPFMFMIIPNRVRMILGKRYDALSINQKRLISPVDLHLMLMTINSPVPNGLTKPISPHRDCSDIPIYSFTPCLCDGWHSHLSDSDDSVGWLAEFVTGYLNNIIQASFLSGSGYSKQKGGYGNCERLVGKRFDKIRVRRINQTTLYIFDIVVERYRGEEVFEVAVFKKDPSRNSFGQAYLAKWRRVSIFQHFRKCLDMNVKPDLCICRAESTGINNPGRALAKLLSSKFFDIRTLTKFIDSRCLVLLIRTKVGSYKSYEMSNLCSDRGYSVAFSLEFEQISFGSVSVAGILPANVTVLPWTIHFITSVTFSEMETENRVREVVDFYKLPL